MSQYNGKFPVFVYGILKKMFPGEPAAIKAVAKDLGPYPAITQLGGDRDLKGKLIWVDADTLAELDLIEGVPTLYTRELIQINGLNVFVYVFVDKESLKDYPTIILEWKEK